MLERDESVQAVLETSLAEDIKDASKDRMNATARNT